MKKVFWFLIAAFYVLTLCFSASEGGKESSVTEENIYKYMEQLATVFTIVEKNYVDPVDQKKLIYGAMKGMVGELDPHSQFMDPDTYSEMRIETEGEFGGIGIEITIKDNLLTIITPIDDTPAYKVGLKAGDKIEKLARLVGDLHFAHQMAGVVVGDPALYLPQILAQACRLG